MSLILSQHALSSSLQVLLQLVQLQPPKWILIRAVPQGNISLQLLHCGCRKSQGAGQSTQQLSVSHERVQHSSVVKIW
jgi:hypothetical protein